MKKPGVFIVGREAGGIAALKPIEVILKKDNLVTIDSDYFNFLLTDTSVGEWAIEKALIVNCRPFGMPTLSVLDFWSNYTARFADARGNLVYLPDTIAVMDELAVSEMVAEGFPREKLVITGQPAFDCLADKRRMFSNSIASEARQAAIRLLYGFRKGHKTIVFCSQPLSRQEYSYGYDEQQVLRLLIDALPKDVDLIIRPHPRDDLADLMHFQDAPRITVQRKDYVHDLLMAADLVVGMNSEILVEACYLGCRVLSIQPGIDFNLDRLPSNRNGHSYPLYDVHWLPYIMESFLCNRDRDANFIEPIIEFPEPAAPKVARLIYERLGIA